MKKNIYRFLKLHYWSRKVLLSKFARIFYSEKDVRKKIFKSIYESYHWRDYKKPEDNESISGRGSDIIKTERFVKEFNIFLKKNKITKILDLGCGDFLWMKNTIIGLPDLISYHGIDIVESLINKNKKKFSNEIIKFSCKDFFEEKIEGDYEIIIIRDVFIHLYNKNIIKFLEKIKLTNAKYIAITSTSSILKNKDLKKEGRYRDINIEIEPFNLNSPQYKLSDIEDINKKDFLNIYEISKIK